MSTTSEMVRHHPFASGCQSLECPAEVVGLAVWTRNRRGNTECLFIGFNQANEEIGRGQGIWGQDGPRFSGWAQWGMDWEDGAAAGGEWIEGWRRLSPEAPPAAPWNEN